MSLDLFGAPVPETLPRPPKRKEAGPNGYAWTPGTGPKGETCGSCRFRRRMSNGGKKSWSKCRKVQDRWTGSVRTDIRVRSPACKHWEAKGEEPTC